MVGIRAEAGSLRPNEGVAERSSVFLVVPRAERGRRGRIVPLVAAGSQSAPMVALSVPMLSRSNTPFSFRDVPSVLAVFVKHKQNAGGIRQKRGKTGKIKNLTVLKSLKTIVKLQKRRTTEKSS